MAAVSVGCRRNTAYSEPARWYETAFSVGYGVNTAVSVGCRIRRNTVVSESAAWDDSLRLGHE